MRSFGASWGKRLGETGPCSDLKDRAEEFGKLDCFITHAGREHMPKRFRLAACLKKDSILFFLTIPGSKTDLHA